MELLVAATETVGELAALKIGAVSDPRDVIAIGIKGVVDSRDVSIGFVVDASEIVNSPGAAVVQTAGRVGVACRRGHIGVRRGNCRKVIRRSTGQNCSRR